MARQLWLLRHGEAEPHGAAADADRRLTSRGEDQSRSAGRALAALEVVIHVALTSPKVRARDTARLACEALGVDPAVHEPLREGFDVDAALEASGAGDRVLVVGHNPDFVQVVLDLTGARVEMRKGAVAAIRLDGRRGELMTLLQPRQLDRIGGVRPASPSPAQR